MVERRKEVHPPLPTTPKKWLISSLPTDDGRYKIFRLSDGRLFCDCLSFLLQEGTDNRGYCGHIRVYLRENQNVPAVSEGSLFDKGLPLSKRQASTLKSLGVEDEMLEHITYAQAYFMIHALLKKQGMNLKSYQKLLAAFGSVERIPLLHFGVEFEFYTKSRERLVYQLNKAGIPCRDTELGEPSSVWRLGTDSSIRAIGESEELELGNFEEAELVSPKLSGADGLSKLKEVLHIVNDVGARTNTTCGLHVHVDACGIGEWVLPKLAKVWAKIEVPFVWYLVDPSRRGNRYCSMVDEEYLDNLALGCFPERYFSLNVRAFRKHGSVEFRLHEGTTDPKIVVPWVVFCLTLVGSVRRGLRYVDIHDTSFEGIVDVLLGMNNKNAVPILKEARNRLFERYCIWKEDAEKHPHHMPEVEPPEIPA